MKLVIKPGDKFSAEVETRLENGRLGYKTLPFILIQNYGDKILAITDQLKADDEGVIFRAYELHELRNIKPNDNAIEVQIGE
jgi:hypothetical protein